MNSKTFSTCDISKGNFLSKIYNMLLMAKYREKDEEKIKMLVPLTYEDSPHVRLQRVFGYSVSDFAFATLKWLDTPYSNELYDELIADISEGRRYIIEELIAGEGYKGF